MPRTGPLPFDGTVDQASFYWVVMEVIDRSQNGFDSLKVAIVSWAFLPKSQSGFAGPFRNCETIDQSTIARFKPMFDFCRTRLLQRFQKGIDWRDGWIFWPDKQM